MRFRFVPRWRRFAGSWLVVLLVAGLAPVGGCKSGEEKGRPRGPIAQANVRDALFESVADNLGRLEEYDLNQIMPQICDRLNQWHLQERPTVEWQPDPMIDDLPPELRKLRVMDTLDLVRYRLADAWYLQEAVWLRDISNGARADQFDDVAVAERLFDWTVRNIQLEPDADSESQVSRHRPYETLLLGTGQAVERAWVFMLLARQQGLNVVLLEFGDPDGDAPRQRLPALLSDGKLYLFDCRLGLPIPGPEGRPVATLAEVIADEGLLRQLDLDENHPYPLTADDLKHVVALIEATPHGLSRRMALVESRLAGQQKMVLTSPASQLAEQLKKVPHVEDVRLWTHPFEIWKWQSELTSSEIRLAAREMAVFQIMPTLITGRALYFKGAYDGEDGAKVKFMQSRPSDEEIDDYRLPENVAKQVKRENISLQEAGRIVLLRHAKQDASFWLGLICFEQEEYPAAVDFFNRRTLKAAPDGPWASAARYNLARTYEAMGNFDDAIALYEADTSAQRHGNTLRARRLRAETKPAAQNAQAEAN